MIVSIASDHAGYELRQKVIKHLEEKGFEVLDGGAPNGTDSFSYVDAGIKVAEDVKSGRAERGIAICGTGIGISLVCNKYKGIRCALCSNEFMAKMCRQHNDANILAFGERVVGLGVALGMVDAFFEEEFQGGRHADRVNGIRAVEDRNFKEE
ncbi:MAG: ribose 5-phosphate isomerase B [Clostridiales bacterium]|jgi:ribose 5-phosphate isomerase B|nr:ribose 5-phosphate isomerase B [Clostridiales bacterium]